LSDGGVACIMLGAFNPICPVRSPVASITAAAAVAGTLFLLFRLGTGGSEVPVDPCAGDPACLTPGVDELLTTEAQNFMPPPGPQLAGEEVCAGAGYLCEGLRQRGDMRVVRWDDGMSEIEIRVPRPTHVPTEEARALQSAAVQGILAWQNNPFPLRVTRSDREGSEDFVVVWAQQLGGSELGRTRTQWARRGSEVSMQVVEFALATHSPWDTGMPLDARQVRLTAAHEMGHALGLPHSDAERDIMYPTNTSTRLTTADYLTMEALYRMENGAEIVFEGR